MGITLLSEKPKVEIESEELRKIVKYDSDGLPIFPAFINGEWYYGNREYITINTPIDLSPIAKVPRVPYEVVENEIDRLYNERFNAKNYPGYLRVEKLLKTAELLEKYSKDFENLLIINAGKTRKQALGEIESTINRIKNIEIDYRKLVGDYLFGEFSKDYLESEGIIKREPLGLILAITPFNYPLFDSVNKIIFSLLPGNVLIIKPPSLDPLPVILYIRLLELTGFPMKYISLITVPGKDMNKITPNKKISSIIFTGSTETGEEIMKNSGIKQYLMELGGGAPAFVLSDTDIDYAAKRISSGITAYSGQRCDSIKIILVEKEIYNIFKEKLIEEISKVKIGDPRDDNTTFGPIADPKTVDEFVYSIEDAKQKGGKILYGGNRLDKTYIEPTLIEVDKENVDKLYLFNKEVFLSVALLVKIDNIDEGLKIIEKRRYGLDAAIFGNNISKIRKIAEYIEVGAVYINDMPRHGIGYYPYGGRKDSGIGREGLGYGIESTTTYKSIVYNYKDKGIWNYNI